MNTNLICIIALTNWLTTNWVTTGSVFETCNVEGCLTIHHPMDRQEGTVTTNEAMLLSYKQIEHLILLDRVREAAPSQKREIVTKAVPYSRMLITTNVPYAFTNPIWFSVTNYPLVPIYRGFNVTNRLWDYLTNSVK